MKKSIFLGSTGLSQSEANHTANVVKELAQNISSEINNMSLTEEIAIIDKKETPYNFIKKVEDLNKKCVEEGSLYALSAWLREGIKAKQDHIDAIQTMPINALGFDFNEVEMELPVESSMINGLSIAERAKYLIAEAKAAHIGKKIHSNGIISAWKKILHNLVPVKFYETRTETVKIIVKPTITSAEIEKLSTDLQKEWREQEQIVNFFKAKLHNLYNEEVARVNAHNAQLYIRFREIQKEADSKRATMLREASDLKIIIPIELEDTLKFVQEYSKK